MATEAKKPRRGSSTKAPPDKRIPELPNGSGSALRVQYVPTARLASYEKNPRQHSAEQIDAIAASIKEFGWSSPIVVDGDYGIVAGHGRHAAAQQLAMEKVPVVQLKHLTPEQRRALVIAENQLALGSSWNMGLLSSELQELRGGGFDLGLLGFDDAELAKLVADGSDGGTGQVAEKPDREMTSDEKELMAVAWRALAKEWIGLLRSYKERGYVSTSFTKSALQVHFLRARFFGDAIPSACTLAYNPHRVEVAGHVGSIIDGLQLVLDDEKAVERLWFVTGGRPRFDAMVTGTLPFLSMRLPGEFPALLARDLYDEHVPAGGTVLDPCHGWGGRMLGFLLSEKAAHYIGFDTDKKTLDGVQTMFRDLEPFAAGSKTFKTLCVPFEEAKLDKASVDFALTSPPYFNTEKYGGELSSWRRYETLEAWVAGFYKPLLTKTASALRPDGVFALQIGSQRYDLESIAKEIAAGCGLTYEETRATDMRSLDREHPEDGEVLVMLRKSEGAKKKKSSADAAVKYGRVM
jgi:ParB-like nuclease family protein